MIFLSSDWMILSKPSAPSPQGIASHGKLRKKTFTSDLIISKNPPPLRPQLKLLMENNFDIAETSLCTRRLLSRYELHLVSEKLEECHSNLTL